MISFSANKKYKKPDNAKRIRALVGRAIEQTANVETIQTLSRISGVIRLMPKKGKRSIGTGRDKGYGYCKH